MSRATKTKGPSVLPATAWLRFEGCVIDPGRCPRSIHARPHWIAGAGPTVYDEIAKREVTLAECKCGQPEELAIDDTAAGLTKVSEYRYSRNWIRAGDTVQIGPSRSGKRDGFLGVLVDVALADETPVELTVRVAGIQRTVPWARFVGKTAKEVR